MVDKARTYATMRIVINASIFGDNGDELEGKARKLVDALHEVATDDADVPPDIEFEWTGVGVKEEG